MAHLDLELLCSEAREYLDTDPRFFDAEEGSFEWWGERVFFTKLPDSFVLEVQGVEVSCARRWNVLDIYWIV